MSASEPMRDGRADLEQVIERRIACRTGGRVRGLRVEAADGRVVVRGHAPSYYLVQLALAAVREVLPSASVDLGIEVLGTSQARPRPAPGDRRTCRAGRTAFRTGILSECGGLSDD